ncbi:hypothetical protein NLU13_3056 [Sarocladium strictum]|uniref:Transcription factor Iwr1 domain-containing protein n=1 Tax=Sarocladium strictum TaxID=5046 RepID=A0AA39GLL7_SARSR|nr:hypothetical protein NLU13_3056 [Sarocladium strictum]
MSIPPSVIRIKRKRDDDAPVTFLQLDGEAKRHRSDSDWVYQRRQTAPLSPTVVSPREARPVIHVAGSSQPTEKRNNAGILKDGEETPHLSVDGHKERRTTQVAPSRRFHISRSMLKKEAATNIVRSGVSKKPRTGPAIFVEKTRKKTASIQANPQTVTSSATSSPAHTQPSILQPALADIDRTTTRSLKKPGAASRIKTGKDTPSRAPPPEVVGSHHEEDMQKIADDLNKWVIDEIGANLESMEQDRRQTKPTSPFRPKAPAQRYRDRHPLSAQTLEPKPMSSAMDMDNGHVSDATDDEGDDGDWIIEEYIRIPVKAMASDVSPTDVGVLVLDGDEATALFYGPENDSDDEFAEDDEDENAENHYTADYPEDEVDSDDEYGRQAYLYRTRNASDDEEYDNETYESSDDMVLDGDGDDDAAMARIKAYMRRHAARG